MWESAILYDYIINCDIYNTVQYMQYQILHLMCYNVAKVKGVMIPVCLNGKEQVFIYGLMFIFNLSKRFDLSHIIT